MPEIGLVIHHILEEHFLPGKHISLEKDIALGPGKLSNLIYFGEEVYDRSWKGLLAMTIPCLIHQSILPGQLWYKWFLHLLSAIGL